MCVSGYSKIYKNNWTEEEGGCHQQVSARLTSDHLEKQANFSNNENMYVLKSAIRTVMNMVKHQDLPNEIEDLKTLNQKLIKPMPTGREPCWYCIDKKVKPENLKFL